MLVSPVHYKPSINIYTCIDAAFTTHGSVAAIAHQVTYIAGHLDFHMYLSIYTKTYVYVYVHICFYIDIYVCM